MRESGIDATSIPDSRIVPAAENRKTYLNQLLTVDNRVYFVWHEVCYW
jgi:hypothetical protein